MGIEVALLLECFPAALHFDGEHMSILATAKTVWLLVTNALLGVVVVACFALICWHVALDIRRKKKEDREQASVPKDYLSKLGEFGVSVGAGEEQIDEMEEA